MKVQLKISYNNWKGAPQHGLFAERTNGNTFKRFIGAPEPEDAIIGRDLLDGNDLIDAIKFGYYAAKAGSL